MLNLIRMDFYHIFRSKSFYICLGLSIAMSILIFTMLYMMATPAGRDFILQAGGELDATAAEMDAAFSGMTLLELYHQGTVGAGFLTVFVAIYAEILICTDFDSGFIKNILATHENKWDYILSKVTCLCALNLLFLAANYAVLLLANVICGNFFHSSSVADVLFYILCAWLLMNGFSALILLICMITRSKSAGVAAAICISSGLLVTILNSALGLLGLQWILDNTLYRNLAALPYAFHGTYGMRPVITGIVFFVIYTVLSKFILAKRDI